MVPSPHSLLLANITCAPLLSDFQYLVQGSEVVQGNHSQGISKKKKETRGNGSILTLVQHRRVKLPALESKLLNLLGLFAHSQIGIKLRLYKLYKVTVKIKGVK